MKKLLCGILIAALALVGCNTMGGGEGSVPLTPEQIVAQTQQQLAIAQFILQTQQQLFEQWFAYQSLDQEKDIVKFQVEAAARQAVIESLKETVNNYIEQLAKAEKKYARSQKNK